MTRYLSRLLGKSRFVRDEEGNSTIEFALLLPLMVAIFLSSFELGMLLARNAMLDRGLDVAVREVRLGMMTPLTEDTLRARVCEAAVIVPDCENQLRLEMLPLDPRNFTTIPAVADCIDRGNPDAPLRQFVPGTNNQLVIVRACVLIDPISPMTGLGKMISEARSDGAYALTSTSAYVVEP